MNITIKDVARAANVSVATVSRVLNNKTNVSPETVRAVQCAVEELGYSPNLLGRDLRKSETRRILAILGSGEQTLYGEVLRGMQDAAYAEGYDVLIAAARNDPNHEMHLLGMLFSRVVDGAVLIAPKLDGKTINGISSRYKLAVCLEQLEAAEVLCVTIDNERAAFDAVSYLIGKGRRRIGLITAKSGGQSVTDRENGYKKALDKAGLPFDKELVYYGGIDEETGARGCEALMSGKAKPDAVFAVSDTIAFGAMTYAAQHGITIGKELMFFGFDNITVPHMLVPGLSTVEQPRCLQGKTVIEKLIANLKSENPDKSTYILPHSLVLRETTGDG